MAAKHLVSELRLHVSVSLVCTYLGTPSYLGCLLQSIRIQAERARRCEGWVEWGGGGVCTQDGRADPRVTAPGGTFSVTREWSGFMTTCKTAQI